MASTGYTLAHPADLDGETSYTFTCGKIDAGIAVLIGSHAHLIEFPSLLLPPGCETGSIVSITCTRDHAAEKAQADSFWDLQTKIVDQFGMESPQPPNLRLRSITQTSVTLEWDKLQLAQCKLLSLSIWKNGQRLGTLPNPLNNTSTKLSGLDLDSEYTFHLAMKTTGGSFNSQQVKVKTHSLNDTSGINVCFGVILPQELKEQAKQAIEQLNGRWSDKIEIDTTHFVCTMPYQAQHGPNKSTQPNTFPSLEYQRALQLSIPVVQPSWLQACLHERKMVPIAAHYLGVQPPPLGSSSTTTPAVGPSGRPRSSSKPNINSSTPISPRDTADINRNSPGSSGVTSGHHGRTNSAPASAVISDTQRLSDQIEKSSTALAVIKENNKDNDAVHNQKMNGNIDQAAYQAYQSPPRNSRSNTIDSEKTLKLSTPEQYLRDEPNVPTPPKFSTTLSDILKENVDSPAENDGSPSGHQLAEFPNLTLNERSPNTTNGNGDSAGVEPEATSPHPSSSPPNKVTSQPSGFTDPSRSSRGILDDGEDDPFSAASPTLSNPSPFGDRPTFSRSNSINHSQFGGLLSPVSNPLSPVIAPATAVTPPHVTEECATPVIPAVSSEKDADGERNPFKREEDRDDHPFKKEEDRDDHSFKKDENGDDDPFKKDENGDESPFKKDEEHKDHEPPNLLLLSKPTPEPVHAPSETGGSNLHHTNGRSEVFDEISIGSDHNHLAEVAGDEDEEQDVHDFKGESGSGDTFFSTASVLPSGPSPEAESHPSPVENPTSKPALQLDNLLDFYPVDLGNQNPEQSSASDQVGQPT
ncbi:hypothetical protein PCASD_01249 [Puccinia coronata f. sp. avenae]|uniref:BRCT domain-containing protein n=2 Tax=Puccinia coronata f. sp. avenae TaxID=200324 RepID=A0A2N5VIZ1_9BASI|nr:hypothetical protein PCASD_01249 [Puccinia coronata f. sp. avenae]